MKPSPNKLHILLACLITSLALTITTNHKLSAHAEGEAGPKLTGEELKKRLTLEPARPGKEFALITLPAEVVLAPQSDHKLAPSMDGKLVKWLVQPGETIEIGQPIAELVARELTDLRASENELNQLVKERQKLVDSLQEQVDLGVQSITTLQEAQAGLSEARGRLTSLRSHAATRRDLGVSPGKNASRWTWIATVSGTVANIQCSPGQLLDPQNACLTILNTNSAQVRVDVPQRLVTGGPNTIDNATGLFSALGQNPSDPNTRQTLTWQRKSPVIDPESRTQSHYFSTPDAKNLIPGTSGRITIIAKAEKPEKTNAKTPQPMLVPRLAVTLIEDKPHVFKWHENDAHAVPVNILGQIDADTLILGEGITEGTPIVTDGVFLVKSQLIMTDDHDDHDDHDKHDDHKDH